MRKKMTQRFKDSFYTSLWERSERDMIKLKDNCRLINEKRYDLFNLVSPEGALLILIKEKKL